MAMKSPRVQPSPSSLALAVPPSNVQFQSLQPLMSTEAANQAYQSVISTGHVALNTGVPPPPLEDGPLRKIYDAMKDGEGLRLEDCHALFRAVDAEVPEEELEDILRNIVDPDASHVTFEQCNNVWHKIIGGRVQMDDAVRSPLVPRSGFGFGAQNKGTGRRCGRARRAAARARGVIDRATTCTDETVLRGLPLLFAVILLTLLTAGGAAGLCIGLTWTQRLQEVKADLEMQVNLVAQVLQSLSDQALQQQENLLTAQARSITTCVESLGYNMTLAVVRQSLLHAVTAVADMTEAAAVKAVFDVYREDLLHSVTSMSLLLNSTLQRNGLGDVVRFVDEANVGLVPSGYEMEIGHWNPASAAAVPEILTAKTMARRDGGNATSVFALESTVAVEAMTRALKGLTGTVIAPDYTNTPCVLAYAPLNGEFGVVFKKDLQTIYAGITTRLISSVNALNLDPTTSLEFALTQVSTSTTGYTRLNTRKFDCEATGRCQPDNVALLSVTGQTGTTVGRDYRKELVIAAYTYLPSMGLGLSVKLDFQEVSETVLPAMGNALVLMNSDANSGTQELQLGRIAPANASTNFTTGWFKGVLPVQYFTRVKYPEACTARCYNGNLSVAMHNALLTKTSGFLPSGATDYREKAVIVAYTYIPEFEAGLVLKVDHSEVSTAVQQAAVSAVLASNEQSDSSREIMLASGTASNIQYLTPFKFAEECASEGCGQSFEAMRRALSGRVGVIVTPDYRPAVPVMAAYDAVNGLGFVIKTDKSEVLAPLRRTIVQVVLGTLAFIVFGLLVTFLVVQAMLRRMRKTWASKLELEDRVRRIEGLLANMYPKRIAEQMLHKDARIVELVPEVTCVMADIHHFTYLSNRLKPEELIDLLGYAFGCMDVCADEYGIYKVKTIGDCYMALAGLPETTSAGPGQCMAAAHFCSAVVQLFSDAFVHPPEGDVLRRAVEIKAADRSSVVNAGFGGEKAMSIPINQVSLGKERDSIDRKSRERDSLDKRPNNPLSEQLSIHDSSLSAGSDVKRTFCIRFGMANGPTTIGVLKGKTPMFDCWSPTINLAARLEAAGQPNMIHVSEGVYQALLSAGDSNPYDFSPPRATYAKGFGTLRSYLVVRTRLPLSKAIVQKLGLEFTFKEFWFGTRGGIRNAATLPPSPQPPQQQAASSGIVVSGAPDRLSPGDTLLFKPPAATTHNTTPPEADSAVVVTNL